MKAIFRKILIATAITTILAFSTWPAAGGGRDQGEKEGDESGIRKGSIYEEEKIESEHGEYSQTKPGQSKRIERAFENSPPLIPHDLTGMLPLAETNNACLNCHMPETARSIGATPMPRSHFFDMDTGKDLGGKLDGKRYFCLECHVPQVNLPEPIKNQFKADFRSKESRTSSNLLDSLNEGVKAE